MKYLIISAFLLLQIGGCKSYNRCYGAENIGAFYCAASKLLIYYSYICSAGILFLVLFYRLTPIWAWTLIQFMPSISFAVSCSFLHMHLVLLMSLIIYSIILCLLCFREIKKIFVILTCLNVCPIQRQHLFLTSPLPHLAVSIRSTSVFLSHRFSRLVESNQLMNASNFLIIVLFVHVSDSHDSTDLSIVWCWLCDVNWDYLLKK